MAIEEWSDLAGRLVGDGHVLPVRVYFEDTDFSGVVYHGAYVRFMERARSDFLRLLGIHHEDLASGRHGAKFAFAVRRMTIDFRRSAGIDDILEIRTWAERLTKARIVVAQVIERDGVVLVEASVEVVMIDDAGKLQRMPEAVLHSLGSSDDDASGDDAG